MGSKLESVKEGKDSVQEQINEAVEKASDDAQEMENVRAALEGVPEDTDDDILQLKEEVEESSICEAVSDMEGDAKASLEAGRGEAEDVSNESEEGETNDRAAGDAYGQVSDTRFAGSAADAQSQAEAGADEFAEVRDATNDIVDDGEDEYEKYLQEIQG